MAPSLAEPAEPQGSELGLSFPHQKEFLLKVQLQHLKGCKTQRRKAHLHPPSRSWPGLLKFAALTLEQTFLSTEGVPSVAGAVPGFTHRSGMGGKPPWDEGSRKRNRHHRARIFQSLSPCSKYRLLFVNELPQSLSSSVLTRKRAWGLLMEKSLSLSALQCGYSYKENRIPCGIRGGGREKEQEL